MGRECRRVPSDWLHPQDRNGDYIPLCPESTPTGPFYQMYEDCSDGTPISPAMETPEQLAHWLVQHEASACGSETATYEGWLSVCLSDVGVPSLVAAGGSVLTGVDYNRQTTKLAEACAKAMPPAELLQDLAAWYTKEYPTVGRSFVKIGLEITADGRLYCTALEIGRSK